MKKKYESLNILIKERLMTDEDPETIKLMDLLKDIKHNGYFTRDQFLKMCHWKSPRPIQFYETNSEQFIHIISTNIFNTDLENKKMKLLTSLNGVRLPVASAILTLTDPQNYGVLDTRVWQLLYLYEAVSENPEGHNFKFSHWDAFLNTVRSFAKKYKVSVRNIERTFFEYHKEIQSENLYQ